MLCYVDNFEVVHRSVDSQNEMTYVFKILNIFRAASPNINVHFWE